MSKFTFGEVKVINALKDGHGRKLSHLQTQTQTCCHFTKENDRLADFLEKWYVLHPDCKGDRYLLAVLLYILFCFGLQKKIAKQLLEDLRYDIDFGARVLSVCNSMNRDCY